MKKLLYTLIFGLLTLLPCGVAAQQGVRSRRFTIAGPDSPINLLNTAIAWHRLTWNVSGTASACTVALDTSANGTTWTAGGAIAGQTCTSNGSSSVVNVAANYVRINMTTLTETSGSSVTVTWDGWVSNPGGGGGGFPRLDQVLDPNTGKTFNMTANQLNLSFLGRSNGFSVYDDIGNEVGIPSNSNVGMFVQSEYTVGAGSSSGIQVSADNNNPGDTSTTDTLELYPSYSGTGNLQDLEGILIYPGSNSGGGVLQNNYGIRIVDESVATTGATHSYAIWTNLGANNFGDQTTINIPSESRCDNLDLTNSMAINSDNEFCIADDGHSTWTINSVNYPGSDVSFFSFGQVGSGKDYEYLASSNGGFLEIPHGPYNIEDDVADITIEAGDSVGVFSNILLRNALVSQNSYSTPTLSGCSFTAQLGGGFTGSFQSGTSGTCTVTITPQKAADGWFCEAHDITTTADTLIQTGGTTAGCTVSGTTVSGDVIIFTIFGF